MTEGWERFAPGRAERANASAEAVSWEQAAAYGVFATASGQLVLRDLRAMTYLSSSPGPAPGNMGLTPEMALYREAQANLVRWIEKRVAAAMAGPPKPVDDSEGEGE